MKKFKTSADKKALEQKSLEDILAEKNLLFNVFFRYIHLPFGIVVSFLVLLVSFLVHRPVLAFENILLLYMSIAAVSLFYMSQTWFAFHAQRAKLHHVKNAFVGSAIYPVLFAVLMLFLAIPLGVNVLACVLGLFLLLGLYHLREQYLSNYASVSGAIIFALYFGLVLWVPILAPLGQFDLSAAGLTVGVAVISAVLFLRFKKILFLNHSDHSEELVA